MPKTKAKSAPVETAPQEEPTSAVSGSLAPKATRTRRKQETKSTTPAKATAKAGSAKPAASRKSAASKRASAKGAVKAADKEAAAALQTDAPTAPQSEAAVQEMGAEVTEPAAQPRKKPGRKPRSAPASTAAKAEVETGAHAKASAATEPEAVGEIEAPAPKRRGRPKKLAEPGAATESQDLQPTAAPKRRGRKAVASVDEAETSVEPAVDTSAVAATEVEATEPSAVTSPAAKTSRAKSKTTSAKSRQTATKQRRSSVRAKAETAEVNTQDAEVAATAADFTARAEMSSIAELPSTEPVTAGVTSEVVNAAEGAESVGVETLNKEPDSASFGSDEPLVLQRPKRSKKTREAAKGQSEAPLEVEAELEKLSGVELVEPQGDMDILASLLPDLPDLPAEGTTAADNTASADESDLPTLKNPVQELLVSQLRSIGRPIHVRELEKSFTRQKARIVGNWRNIESVLEDLARAGLVVRTRKKTYGLPGAMNLVRGRFQASAAGFGFVVPDSGREDYYVPPEATMEAWNGDTVLVRPEGHGARGSNSGRRGGRFDGNPQASVVRIVQRHYSQLVGTLEYSHGYPILKADDFRARHRILLANDGLEDLAAGARVVADLYWPEATGEDEVFGAINRVLGEEDDPETETEAVMVKYGLRGEFPAEVLREAERIPSEIPDEALRGRLDLRHLNTFTVDGRDAKDFDDAIHIQPTDQGTFLVGVHIADVSHYVKAGGELDGEAYARATSVYLPGRVLPMLPEHLSNGVCSLVPYEDRLTMSALVELSADAEILNVEIGPSVIHSKARLTYDEVQAYSEGTSPMPEHARQLEGDLHLLLKVTSKLRQKRLREGSLDFKMREVKVDVDAEGRMELIPLREETARGMIEDLMLLANKVVANFLLERQIPTLFRIHEEPTMQRFQDVSQAIGRLGLAFPGGEPTPQAYQDVLKQVRGTPRESVVNTLLLRSMQQAKYAGENLGHFGLAFDEYLHFTSPIRRYPDLMVHRVLRGVLRGELRSGSREVDQLRSVLPSMGEHTSDRERNAAEAERDLTKYYQAKWAQEHEGRSFMGSVSGVVASGLFVALENGVEGKLHISHLDDDYYIYLEDAQMLKGRSRGRTFRLGDPLAITISEVKPLARQIDFTVPEDGTELEEIVMSDEQPSGNETQPSGQTASQAGQPNQTTQSSGQRVSHQRGPKGGVGLVSGQKVRARRRDDREQERRQKLSSVRPTQPRFTLEEDLSGSPAAPARSSQPRRTGGRNAEGGGREGNGDSGREHGGRGRDRNRSAGSNGAGGGNGGHGRRRVITLERPRSEHLRPVNITVQRMYFGDWNVSHMPEDEGGQGSGGRSGRGYNARGGSGAGRSGNRSQSGAGRSSEAQRRPEVRPAEQRQDAQARSESAAPSEHGVGNGESDRRRRNRRRRRTGAEGVQG